MKNELLESYDQEYLGRNRRYYKITEKGCEQLNIYREEWLIYKEKINSLISEQTDKGVNL